MDIYTRLIRIQEALNPKDGADVQMKGIRDRLPGRAEATRQAIAKNPKVSPEVITRVVNRLAKARTDLTQANIRDGLKSDVDPLLADMQRQNQKAVANLIKRTGKSFIPSKPATGVFNFREGVDIQGLLRKHRAGKRIGVTNLNRLKARGLVKRADGTKVDQGNRGIS